MEQRLPEPIVIMMEAVYDTVVELGEGTKNPGMFQHDFWGNLTRVELAMLKQRADMTLPVFPHPLPAMKTYRSFMCGASIYEGLGAAKLRIRDFDTFEMRYWRCPYAPICAPRETKLCMRTHSLAEAAELLSPVNFEEIESLTFSEEGNCVVFVRFHFTGDLREIEPEDRTIDERPCMHLTREEADTFLLRTVMAGAEYSCSSLPEVNMKQALRGIAERVEAAGMDKRYLQDYPMLKRALKYWKKGENAFIHQG